MKASLFKTMLSASNMAKAWKRLKTDKAIWQPGVNHQDFTYNQLYYLFQLRDDLESEQYRPELLRRFTLSKANGKDRLLSALTLRDKLAQRLVLQAIEPACEAIFHPASFGYRPGRSRFQAMEAAKSYLKSGLYWVVDADIKQFFDSIPHKQLRKILHKQFKKEKQILKLNKQWLDIGAIPSLPFKPKTGIPQGGVLSPLWCNLYLHQLDHYFSSHNIAFIRYADDFLLFANSKKQAEKLLQQTKKQLQQLGLQLNKEKTHIRDASKKPIQFLGLHIKTAT